MAADDTAPKQRGRPFEAGQSGNPAGRPKGARNKLNEEFVQKLCDDFQRHGADVIEKVRDEKPDVYLKVVASLAPKHVEIKDLTLDDFDPADLTALLDAVRQARLAGTADREGHLH